MYHTISILVHLKIQNKANKSDDVINPIFQDLSWNLRLSASPSNI